MKMFHSIVAWQLRYCSRKLPQNGLEEWPAQSSALCSVGTKYSMTLLNHVQLRGGVECVPHPRQSPASTGMFFWYSTTLAAWVAPTTPTTGRDKPSSASSDTDPARISSPLPQGTNFPSYCIYR